MARQLRVPDAWRSEDDRGQASWPEADCYQDIAVGIGMEYSTGEGSGGEGCRIPAPSFEGLAIFASDAVVTPSDVKRLRIHTIEPAVNRPAVGVALPKLDRLADIEREHIRRVLAETGGNRSEAARRLGIERKTLYKKATRLGIDLNQRER